MTSPRSISKSPREEFNEEIANPGKRSSIVKGVYEDKNRRSAMREQEIENRKTCGRRFIDDWCFNLVIYVGIGLNAVQMGLELQFEREPWKSVWFGLEQLFCIFFLFEMLAKWWGMGLREYFAEKANILDFVVVAVAVLDNWILAPIASDAMEKLDFIALLRMARLARILKLLKAKRELMILIEGILSSIRSMFWLSILLCILIYTVAICFVKFIGRSDAYPAGGFDNRKYFGDMAKACMTGLNLALLEDWSDVVRPVLEHQPIFAILIFAYVSVSCFGIMNAIIGVIVERTSEAAAQAKEEDDERFRRTQMAFVEEIKDIVYEIDTDGDGTVSPEEIALAAHNEELNQALDMIDLPSEFTLEEVHAMLDKDGDGELTKDEFRQGMHRLIFSNEFQRQCLLMLAMAQQKRRAFQSRQEVNSRLDDVEKMVRELPAKVAEAMANSVHQHLKPPDPDMNDTEILDLKETDENLIIPSVPIKVVGRKKLAAPPAWNKAAVWEQVPPPDGLQTPIVGFGLKDTNDQQPYPTNVIASSPPPNNLHSHTTLPGQLGEEQFESDTIEVVAVSGAREEEQIEPIRHPMLGHLPFSKKGLADNSCQTEPQSRQTELQSRSPGGKQSRPPSAVLNRSRPQSALPADVDRPDSAIRKSRPQTATESLL